MLKFSELIIPGHTGYLEWQCRLFLFFLCGFLSGTLIGAAGIGGVVLVPLLVYGAGYSIHISIAAAVSSFIFSGLIGTFAYAKRGEVNWLQLTYLTVGAVPGALVGTHALSRVNADFLILFIATVLILASYKQIANLKFKRLHNQSTPSNISLLFVGFFYCVPFCAQWNRWAASSSPNINLFIDAIACSYWIVTGHSDTYCCICYGWE
jgi:uncharacterized membrane protein YfcA